jgi:hypothetical protein
MKPTFRASVMAFAGLLAFLILCPFGGEGVASVGSLHPISVGDTQGLQLADVSYNQYLQQYLVVFERLPCSGDPNVYGAVLNASGSMVLPPFPIAATTSVERSPRAATCDGEYWVVAFVVEGLSGPGSHTVRVARLNRFGEQVYYDIASATNPIPHLDIGASDYATNYLIVWDLQEQTGEHEVRARFFDDESGAMSDELVVDTEGDCEDPAVNQRGVDYLVAYEHRGGPPAYENDIRGCRVSAVGEVGTPFCINDDDLSTAKLDPSVASDCAGCQSPSRFCVAWSNETAAGSASYDVKAAFLLDEAVQYRIGAAASSADEITPCVAAVGLRDTYLVSYASDRGSAGHFDVLARSLTAQGVLSPEETIAADASVNGGNPEATSLYSDGKVAVVWDRSTNSPPVADTDMYARDWALATDSIGLYDPNSGTVYLRNANSAGVADLTFRYGPYPNSWGPFSADRDKDGKDGVGLYNPATGTFYLRDANSPGPADATFRYGPRSSTWIPLAGDWDDDGLITIGLYNPANGTFYLRNSNSAGVADLAFRFGPAPNTWLPIAGDWNGDGVTTVGLYDLATGTFYLRNQNSAGPADLTFRYGPTSSTWKPIVGDWNHDGLDTIGLYSPATATFYLRDANFAGSADRTFRFGPAPNTWKPITGDWDGI